jgi:hypothetical protein
MNNIFNIFVTLNQDGSLYGSSKYLNSDGVIITRELSQEEIVAIKDIVDIENSK